jgi:hypothetical protein
MTPWWDRITAVADEDRGAPTPTEAQRRSIYDIRDMADPRPPTHSIDVAGFRVEVPTCCANPALCERQECWRPLSGWGRWP